MAKMVLFTVFLFTLHTYNYQVLQKKKHTYNNHNNKNILSKNPIKIFVHKSYAYKVMVQALLGYNL